MKHRIHDLQYCAELFDAFYDIGSTPSGGVTRLGYTETEDAMHRRFAKLAEALGCTVSQDAVGNTYACFGTQERGYTLIGSHLDSVVEGGRYDGVAGLIAALMLLHWAKEDSLELSIKAVAFRCEESSNFGLCTIGSGLITDENYKPDIGSLTDRSGQRLDEIFEARGYSLHPEKITGAERYLELHIEQGKVLEELETQVGIVNTIAGNRRFRLILRGMAEHSGATPMSMRCDAMCAAAELILAIEQIGQAEAVHASVATVGIVKNQPNVMNVIPGEVELGVDIRGIQKDSLDRMEQQIRTAAQRIAEQRGAEFIEQPISQAAPVEMSASVQQGLTQAARKLRISSRNMPSGAGHDAMSFAPVCDTGMIFIPCRQGISHNRMEYAEIEAICDGARVLYEYLKGGNV